MYNIYLQNINFIRTHVAIFAVFCSILLIMPCAYVSAASIQFEPRQNSVGADSPFRINIVMDTDVPINTIRMVIDVPEYMDILEASDGNSIINMWIERPHITEAHQLIFAGIIPGGFAGNRGKLLTLTVQALKQSRGAFIVNASSRLYANDQKATPQTIISRPLELSVVPGRVNVINIMPDRTPPESFVPVLVKMPDGGAGSWAASFEAQDKDSGIASYSVVESTSRYRLTDTDRLLRLSWHEETSPYILADQQLQSYIYIKATDMSGVSRFAVIAPVHGLSWYRTPVGYILIALLIFLVLHGIARRLHLISR